MNVGTTIIKSRHSVRKYKPDPVDETTIRDVLECARHAPTAMNLQPWLFGVVRDRDLLKKIADLTDHGKFIADAAICIAVFGEKKAKYYLEDCCAATETLILGLQSYGVGSCWVAGEKKEYAEAVRKLLDVPGNYTLVSLVPAGFPAEIAIQKKKDLDDITFSDKYKEQQ
ncbi:MAG: nitroreductase A [Methanoregulaceae archaeon PtaU1.Bin059]|jgi:nitroreductase|nr:MAG: nitroreductase A [Methanoregulaceae archaeon PtaB.Bin009]OPY36794.1 MAG: nitroreductase A [Methanoregulaceae archaeon PtaU1.Bin059]HII76536.1 nitroreductase family protein [Methanolinea sp.]HNQ28916.1 nitroreductase family protein [Methanolinea sp.]